MSIRFFHCSFFFTRWMDGDALFPRLLSPSIILRNGPPCCSSEYLPEGWKQGGAACFSIPGVEGATWPHKLYYQGVVSLSSPAGFIAAIAEFMIDGPRFCSRFQFGRLYAVHVLRTTLFLPCRQQAGPLLLFCPRGWGRRATNSELPSAEYLGSIFVFLGSKRAFGSDRRTEMEGPFLNANLRPPPPPLLQMRR